MDNTLFEGVLYKRGIHHKIGKTSNAVRRLRYRHRKGEKISYETKFLFLRQAGINHDQMKWTDKDMMSLLRFYLNTSEMARQFGPEYVFEKFKINRTQL